MSYTIINLRDVEDKAPGFGLQETGEARFAREALEARDTGLAYHALRPGKRQGFGHRHHQAEELHVVIAGGGRVRLDDEIRDIEPLDAIRIAPEVARCFEAGPDGLALLVFGPHHESDGEMLPDFWKD
jgi:uncharacterized cupin superfamily protein